MKRALLFVPWLTLSACADTTISLQGYYRACVTVDDCVAVRSGEVCVTCDCGGNDVINVSELDKYNAVFKAKQASCEEPPGTCRCPPPPNLACSEGTCTIWFD